MRFRQSGATTRGDDRTTKVAFESGVTAQAS
jgi:hypothetical protein